LSRAWQAGQPQVTPFHHCAVAYGKTMHGAVGKYVLHADPAWRIKANYILNAQLQPGDQQKKFEQLWVRRLGDARFELCCIPFFLYDFALADVIGTVNVGDQLVVDGVLTESGRYVFRVWFGGNPGSRGKVVEFLDSAGSLYEWSSRNMLAADAPDPRSAQHIADFLLSVNRARS
jgi:hypothetical protein